MSSELEKSVILITSSDLKRRDFGTGFVIHRDEQAAYVLTCAHVVRDVGGSEQVRADGIPATVIALGEDDGFDLAVLRVEEPLNKPQLSLCVSGETGKRFILAGHYLQDKAILSRQISGKLGQQIGLVSRGRKERTNAWDLEIDGNYYLQPGYSGSPVIDETSGDVLGIVSQREGKGERGLAISIEALAKISWEMPFDLLNYSRLRNLLAAGKWKEADRETGAIMLKVAGREKEGWLNAKSIENFPCTDLRTIDTLWGKYSNGHFGFSVQKRIWQEVNKSYRVWSARVGWSRKGKDYDKNYLDFTFSINVPPGYLPTIQLSSQFLFETIGNLSERSDLYETVSFITLKLWGVRGIRNMSFANSMSFEELKLGLGMQMLFSRVETCKLHIQ
jgi:hypothetical protein